MAGRQWGPESEGRLPAVGAPVEVRQRYTDGWSGGFEVVRVDLTDDGPAVAIRRRSDGSVLPATFDLRDVRST